MNVESYVVQCRCAGRKARRFGKFQSGSKSSMYPPAGHDTAAAPGKRKQPVRATKSTYARAAGAGPSSDNTPVGTAAGARTSAAAGSAPAPMDTELPPPPAPTKTTAPATTKAKLA